MGGVAKHLLEIDGEPLLARVVRALSAARVSGVSVVLRAEDRAGEQLTRRLGALPVAVSEGSEGRAASVRAGVESAPGTAQGLLFAQADQPFLAASDFDALITAFGSPAVSIVHASYAGVRGSPVLFGATHRTELLGLGGGQGGRVLLDRHGPLAVAVEIDPGRGRDLDTPQDLGAARAESVDGPGRTANLGRPMERTLSIIKPDAVAAQQIGSILEQIEQAGLRIVALRMLRLSRALAEGFYEVHRERPFFSSLVEFMTSGPVVVSVLEGDDAIQRYRKLMGATDPEQADEGTIRKRFATNIERNAVHGSDASETARQEVAYFFPAGELVDSR